MKAFTGRSMANPAFKQLQVLPLLPASANRVASESTILMPDRQVDVAFVVSVNAAAAARQPDSERSLRS